MKFLKLLYKNLFRNWLRTGLTVASLAASIFLVATLLTILFELTSPADTPESALRLVTRHKISLFNSIPYSYREKIANVEGVDAVIGSMWYGGVYKDPENFFANFAVDPDGFFRVNADMKVSDAQREAWENDRAGALVGENLAERFGWKLGDTVHLKGSLFPFDVELKVRALYAEGNDDGSSLFFHWKYFNEGARKRFGPNLNDFTGTYNIRVTSPEQVPLVAERIDALFKNTTTPTKTETEKAFLLSFVSMLGNVKLLITSICLAVIFAVLLVAANTMAMSIRERVREIGIFKALGFRRSQVLGLLLGESMLVALGGATLGLLLAKFLLESFNLASVTSGFLQNVHVSAVTWAICLGVGTLIGIFSAGVPAWRAAQRPVVAALRNVA